MIRTVDTKIITENVKEMCIEANHYLSKDMDIAMKNAVTTEKSELGRKILNQLQDNLKIADEEMIPICQDTGMAVIFLAEPQKQGSRMGQTDSVRPLVGAIQENHEAGQPHHPVRTRDVHRRTDPLATRLVEIQPRVDERPCKRALERQPYAAASA